MLGEIDGIDVLLQQLAVSMMLFHCINDKHGVSRIAKKPVLGFLTKSSTNWAVQPLKMASRLNFRI